MRDHFRQSRQASYRGVEPIRRAVNGAIPLAGKRHHLRLGAALGRERAAPTHPSDAIEQYERAPLHSITSSAATRRPGGTVRPSAFAVLRLRTVSYLVGA